LSGWQTGKAAAYFHRSTEHLAGVLCREFLIANAGDTKRKIFEFRSRWIQVLE
jgi:hypothetical protein